MIDPIEIGTYFVISLIILAISLLIHELGHYLYFKLKIGKSMSLEFNRDKDKKYYVGLTFPEGHNSLTNSQMAQMYFSGIFLGIIPIIFASFINIIYFILMPIYLLGCVHDFKSLIHLGREK